MAIGRGIIERLKGLVTTLNGLSGDIILAAGANMSVTPTGNTLTFASTGGGSGSIPQSIINTFG